MQTIKINVVDKVATAEGNPFIVCGNSDYTIVFNFDKAWNGYNAKTARFIYEQDGEEIIAEVPFAGNSCKAPVINNAKKVDIGVYAGDILSTSRCRINCRVSILDGEGIEHEEPPKDIYNEMVAICNDAVTAAVEATAAAEGFEATTRETFANAFKNTTVGSAVRVEDVSPVEHNLACKIESKNMLPYPYVDTTKTENGITFTDNGDGTVKVNGTATADASFVLSTYSVKAHTSYFISGCPAGGSASSYYWHLRGFNYDMGQGAKILNASDFTHQGEIVIKAGTTVSNIVFKPQLERGTIATEYTSYVNPSKTKVSRYGKNLFNKNQVVKFAIVTEAGVEKVMPGEPYRGYYIPCNEGEVYSISRTNKDCNRFRYTFTESVPSANVPTFGGSAFIADYSNILEHENVIVPAGAKYLFLYLSNQADNIHGIQIETGSAVTEYEEFKSGDTYSPNADGTVEGITSLSPTMTLLTDTEGAIIHCEYNRDANKVFTGNNSSNDMVTANGTVVSPNADFAEVAEWADGNPDNEDRTGYFVCANVPVDGIVMKKATSLDDVKGVTILAPAFAGNYTKDKLDSAGNLLPKYSYVAIIGFVPVRDNGTCTVGGRCMPDDNGCAIPSSNNMGYQVVNRIDENRVLIIIEPNGDMVQRVKTEVNQIQEDLEYVHDNYAGVIKETASGKAISVSDMSDIEHKLTITLNSPTITDFSNVKVSECGKNLLDGNLRATPKTENGVTVQYLPDEDVYLLNGVAETKGSYFLLKTVFPSCKGATYTLTVKQISGGGAGGVCSVCVGANDVKTAKGSWLAAGLIGGNTASGVLNKNYACMVWLYFPSDNILLENLKVKIMLTLEGDNSYEPYIEPQTVAANADGTVEGLPNLYPYRTIYTDTDDVTINYTYNVDTKKYIDNKFAQLQAMILEG